MKKMTRIALAIALMALLVLALAACGGNQAPEPPPDPAQTADTEATGTDDGRAFIPDPNRVYTIMTGFDFPPFQFFDPEVGEVVGFDLDLFTAIAEDQGFNFEFSHDTFSANMGAVQSGAADGMIAAMTITEVRRETFDFSDGYFNAGQILTVGADSDIAGMSDLGGLVVAAKIGTVSAIAAEHYREVYGFADVMYFDDSAIMFAALIQGNVDAVIDDRPVVEWSIQHANLPMRTVGDTLNPAQYGFSVRRGDNSELIYWFNMGMANLRASGVFYELLAKYGLSS